MVARSSSDASTYSSAETRGEIKGGGGGGELGACTLGSLVGTLAFVVARFTILAKHFNEMLRVS